MSYRKKIMYRGSCRRRDWAIRQARGLGDDLRTAGIELDRCPRRVGCGMSLPRRFRLFGIGRRARSSSARTLLRPGARQQAATPDEIGYG